MKNQKIKRIEGICNSSSLVKIQIPNNQLQEIKGGKAVATDDHVIIIDDTITIFPTT